MSLEELSGAFSNAVIKVIGVGGGGNNAVKHMLDDKIEDVEFYCANTDLQALENIQCPDIKKIPLGDKITKGLGAGANPEIGRKAAEENQDQIQAILQGSDMVFITAGMGGGTGTGAAPVFARIAKELGILTVAVVTRPFGFEGRQRAKIAEQGIAELTQHVDSLITIPNDKLLQVLGKNITLINAFKAANKVLDGAVQGISDLITRPGLINVDFADVRTVMSEMGMAMMGTGRASGENRARIAAEAAIASPLLEDVNLAGARGILVNITAGLDMSIGEFEEVGNAVKVCISDEATFVVGTVIDPQLNDELRVTVIVTGLAHAQPAISAQTMNAPARSSIKERRLEQTKKDGSLDYTQLERPTVLRRPLPNHPLAPMGATTGPVQPLDYLDIPAFLRRQEEMSTEETKG